ncbi:MAG: hypothetical protein JXR76_29035 [Deltaproteobacteria bacterium]|nr:hypothetical protein [Deltaproteobacteria bacterium]
MRKIGFSTGALALSNFELAIQYMKDAPLQFDAVEISALRVHELAPLIAWLERVDFCLPFGSVVIHAPSVMNTKEELEVADLLHKVHERQLPIVLHADAYHNAAIWRQFDDGLLIENMDKRKPGGRTADELDIVFDELPDAALCFDIGHARQIDPTMIEASEILKRHGQRLKQIHLSEVTCGSKHVPLSYTSIVAVRSIAQLIPIDIPIILEAQVEPTQMLSEVQRAEEALNAFSETDAQWRNAIHGRVVA